MVRIVRSHCDTALTAPLFSHQLSAINRPAAPRYFYMATPRPRRLCPLSKKIFQSGVILMFMLYVILCLHELRNQRVDGVQVIVNSDDPALISNLENLISVRTRSKGLTGHANVDTRYDVEWTRKAAVIKGDLSGLQHVPLDSDGQPRETTAKRDSSETLTMDDVHISVKTSKKFHRQRLDVILQTWFTQAKGQIYFITDDEDGEYLLKTDGHLVYSNCSNSHHRKALCCKMSVELDFFILKDKKWFCHFDDDNYVHIQNLLDLLRGYDPTKEWYLGKPSIKAPLELPYLKPSATANRKPFFWFATGGAGFCISNPLMKRMKPLVADGKFMSIGETIRLPDDVTIGYVIEHLLQVPLTNVDRFHSHLEPLHVLDGDILNKDVSFSYSTYRGDQMNRVSVSGWDSDLDPTRFLSLHCYYTKKEKHCTGFTTAEKMS